MKKLIFLLALTLLFGRCGDDRALVIEGEVRADRSFDGEWLYILPMNGDMSLKDSVMVEGGRFTFAKEVDSAYVAMLRPKNFVQTYFLQPLLVVVEPGTLTVRLDSVSHGKGTPLNEIIQVWKDDKVRFDAERMELRRQARQAAPADKAVLDEQFKKNMADYTEYNFKFVKKNKDNPVGMFVYTMTKSIFTEEQQNALGMPQ